MDSSAASIPFWLLRHFQQSAEPVPFSRYMDWVLNDPEGGYYGSGSASIGPQGDFVTSPSLGQDFGEMLALQLSTWLRSLADQPGTLSIVEVGPGEGDLSMALVAALPQLCPELIGRLELVLVEANPGMRRRQEQKLAGVRGLRVRWSSWDDLLHHPLQGVMVAHELLDALPVDRLIQKEGALRLQTVGLTNEQTLKWEDMSLPASLAASIGMLCSQTGCAIPPEGSEEGWTSEWHSSLATWMDEAATVLPTGWLLVIDYAMEAARYYHPQRSQGTLMTYHQQRAGADPLMDPGALDITAHLCLESLAMAADQAGWTALDTRKQGEALLALGLAQRLHGLQRLPPNRLSEALQRREALLRLVDPAALGDFRWILLGQNVSACFNAPDGSGNPESRPG